MANAENKRSDWPHKILKILFKEYSGFNGYLNPFFINELKIGTEDGNLGRKVFKTLQELRDKNLITLEVTGVGNIDKEISLEPNDNTTVLLSVYWFHARLTFDGLEYIGHYIRDRKQEKLNKSIINNSRIQRNTAIVIAFITGITMLVGVANFWLASHKSQQNLLQVSPDMQSKLDSTLQSQKVIDSSLRTMAKDPVKKIRVLKK